MEYDTFSRPDQSDWGTATNGETWSIPSGSATLSIASNSGVVTGATSVSEVQFGTSRMKDSDILVRTSFSSSSGDGSVSGIFLRATNYLTNAYYMFFISYSTPGDSAVIIEAPGVTVVESTMTISTNTFYWIHARANGPDLYIKVWEDGLTEPSAPTVALTNFTFPNEGLFGLLVKNVNAGSSVTFDHFCLCGDE